MTTETGGPAFPTHPEGALIHDGMTLLDYFASKAMQALLSDPGWRHDMDFEETASAAYRQAVKMLKVRNGQT